MDLKFKNGSLHPARENNYWYCPLHGSINISMKNPCKYCLKKFLNDDETTDAERAEANWLCYGIKVVERHLCKVCDVWIVCRKKQPAAPHEYCGALRSHNKGKKHMERVKNDTN